MLLHGWQTVGISTAYPSLARGCLQNFAFPPHHRPRHRWWDAPSSAEGVVTPCRSAASLYPLAAWLFISLAGVACGWE